MTSKVKVKVAERGDAMSNDAGLKRVLLCCEGREPLLFPSHPRYYHAPMHLCHAMASVRLMVEPNDPRATVTLNGTPLVSGQASPPLPLACGRNVFLGSIMAADGLSKVQFNCKVFRDFPQPAWTKVTEAAPWKPRDSAGELVFHDRMWLLGGYIPETTNDVWSSTNGVDWRREGDVPSRRGIDIPIAFVFHDRLWVVDVDGVLFSSADGQSWSVATAEAPWGKRHCAGCAVFKDRVWVMGGSKDGVLLNDIWSSVDGVNWVLEAAQAPWAARQITHTPLVLDGKMWLLGGGALGSDYYPFVAWNDVWSTTDGKHWEQVLAHAPWVSRIWGSSVVYRDRLWMIAGFRSEPTWENLGDAWYSANGVDWRRLETAPAIRHSGFGNAAFTQSDAVWAPRHEQSVYAMGDTLWVAGGMIWPLKNDVWRLSLPGLCFVTQPVVETYANGLYEYRAHADFNRSRQPVHYRLKRGPSWLTVDAETGCLRGIGLQPGDAEVRLEAYDAGGETAQQEYTLHVLPCR